MRQDQTRAAPVAGARIATEDETQLTYWIGRLGVSREELKEAVDAVGDMPEAVAAYLGIALD